MVENLYFDWLISFVYDDRLYVNLSYRKLLETLYSTPFSYTIPLDDNRYQDGMALRYKFSQEFYISEEEFSNELDYKPCSILEMMIALSIRIEEHIMGDPEIGDRTSQWFWGMISSLGLGSMTDANFDIIAVNDILKKFVERRYLPDGEGGLFTINSPPVDLRDVEIWYQANWFLNTL